MVAIELKKIADDCASQFQSIVYCSYRKGFKPLLTESRELRAYIESIHAPGENLERVMTTSDAGWGCTIR